MSKQDACALYKLAGSEATSRILTWISNVSSESASPAVKTHAPLGPDHTRAAMAIRSGKGDCWENWNCSVALEAEQSPWLNGFCLLRVYGLYMVLESDSTAVENGFDGCTAWL